MSEEMSKHFSELLVKGRQAQTAMWSAIGTAFGFLVSTSSVIAAFKKDVSGILVYPLIIVCFCGISAILGCFIRQKKTYVQQISDLPRLYRLSTEEKIKEAESVIHASDPIARLEK